MKLKKITKMEKQKDKMFKPNFSKPKFKVEIIVYENCQTMQVIHLEENIQVSYQEVIGALSISHQNFITDQMKINKDEYKKLNQNGSK